MSFDLVFPPYIYFICAALVILTLCITWWRYLGQIKKSYLLSISICRLVALILALIFALQPYTVDEKPDKDSFEVKIFVDVSKSMESSDCEGRSRLSVAQEIIQKSELIAAIRRDYNTSMRVFSSRLEGFSPEKNMNLQSLTGGTDLSLPLKNGTESSSKGSLGAVVLLSDGQQNIGDATTYAKELRRSGVTVTTIGIGGEKELDDVELSFFSTPKTAMKNREFELLVKVKKNLQNPFTREVVLSQGEVEIAREIVNFPAGKTEQIISFKTREFTGGFKNYRAYIEPLKEEMIKSNNVDYAAVEITEDQFIKILYFSGSLSWDYKFLDNLCRNSENLHLTALLRSGEKAWYYYAGKDEKTFENFPETTELIEYDVIIFDLGAEYLIDQQIAKNLEKFAFDKGGGILFIGKQKSDSLFINMLPLTKSSPEANTGKRVLDIPNNSILVPRSKKDLTDLNNNLLVKSGKTFYASTENDLKKSARADLKLKGSGKNILMSSLHYGAGRSVFLGTETWTWKINANDDGEYYDLFWKRLLTWLSSSSVEQMKVIPAYKKLPAGEVVDLAIDLLDPNFEPSLTAKVAATLKTPSGDLLNLQLLPSIDIEGRFGIDFVPTEVGEYQLTVNSTFADKTELSKKVSFLASETSGENGTLPLNRRLLEDISRITGGDYIHWSDVDKYSSIKLNSNIPLLQIRSYVFNSWLTLCGIIFFFCLEWYLRRRIGLS